MELICKEDKSSVLNDTQLNTLNNGPSLFFVNIWFNNKSRNEWTAGHDLQVIIRFLDIKTLKKGRQQESKN